MARNSHEFLRTIRKALATWKQAQLQNSVKEDQDTMKLNLFLKQTANAYYMLKDYLDSNTAIVSDPSLRQIVEIIGDKQQLSDEQEMLLRDSLFRDLIEYPFTYNTTLINGFSNSNALNTNIVPNK